LALLDVGIGRGVWEFGERLGVVFTLLAASEIETVGHGDIEHSILEEGRAVDLLDLAFYSLGEFLEVAGLSLEPLLVGCRDVLVLH
jgi:hypothetical protein